MFTKEKTTEVSHTGHRQRLLTTIENSGLDKVNDYLALEFILTYVFPRIDTNPLAHKLLNRFGSIANVLDASVDQLESIEGVGKNSARLIAMLPKIFNRYTLSKNQSTTILATRFDVIKYCRHLLSGRPNEEMYAICLNARFKLLGSFLLARGEVNEVIINPKSLAKSMLSFPNVKYIILTHSHPDGVCKPSNSDISSTNEVEKLLKTFQIELYDHIIIGTYQSYGIKDNRYYAD